MIDTRKTVLLTMAVFILQPLAFGGWLALIPHVKETLGLDKAQLAIALLGMPVALVPGLQVASRVISKFGPRRVLSVAFPLQAVVVALPLLAVSQTTLFLALMIFGGVGAFLQVSLNVYAGRLEKERGVVVMSRCHGFWALGVMAGSLLMSWLVGLGPLTALLLISLPAAGLGMISALKLPHLGAAPGGAVPPRRRLGQIPPALYYISLFALAVSMTEGAMSDWAAVYLAERLPDGATHAGIAVSIFAGFLAAGRFIGDAAKVRFGVITLARGTVFCAMAGLALLILPLPLFAAYIGFALVGLGASVGFPLGVSAAAALDDTYEGANIAAMSMTAISGFLVGPPLIGFLAETYSLRIGLAALLPGLILALWLSRWLRIG